MSSGPPWVLGADLAPTHYGAVLLDGGGGVVAVSFVTWTKADSRHAGGIRLPAEFATAKTSRRIADPAARDALRLRWMMDRYIEMLRRMLIEVPRETDGPEGHLYVVVEDYATSMEQGSHMIGEAGGVFRAAALGHRRVRLRLHDPLSVKLYATGRGDQRAKDVIAGAVQSRWGVSFRKYGKASDDLADAYVLARMGLEEYEVRYGHRKLSDCPESSLRVFNRVTKAYPINVLGREWIEWSEPEP